MKITKVSYGRTIEVGGPFGKRPVEKVWFGWDVELNEDLPPHASAESVMSELHDMADEQERIEKEEYRARKLEQHEAEKLAIYNETMARMPRGRYAIRRTGLGDEPYLQHSSHQEIKWGPYETAYVATSQDDAAAYAVRRGLTDKDYGIFPGPARRS